MSKITVFLNGKARQVDSEESMEGLLNALKLSPKMILVEYNNRALLRREWESIHFEHGDRVELIRVVAGG